MAAERGAECGRVGVHVEHRLQHVAHVADARPAQVVERARDGAPRRKLGVGVGVAFEHAEDHVGHGPVHARGDPGELGHRTDVVVAELHEGGRARVVHRAERLQRHEHDRDVEPAQDAPDGGRGCVGDHVDQEQIEVGRFQPGQERRRARGIVHEAELDYAHPERRYLARERLHLAVHLVEEPGELAPVDVVPHAEEPHVRRERFASRNDHAQV